MDSSRPGEFYSPSLVPALNEIQDRFGYLERGALKEYARNSGVPLYRLQAVASFFPRFRLSAPREVTLRVCRDLACHLVGSEQTLAGLQGLESARVAIRGASCLGRCDRAPAASLAIAEKDEEGFYLGRSAGELRGVVEAALRSEAPAPDLDAAYTGALGSWKLDPYEGKPCEYRAVRAAIAARDRSLDAATVLLRSRRNWNLEELALFRRGALQGSHLNGQVSAEVAQAVRCWQTEEDWAKGPELGGWADAFFQELDTADLRGLGGAGIPARQKWQDVRDAVRDLRSREREGRAYIVVNGDESEPGTFKDREILLHKAHTVLEGVILAGLLTEATQGFIFIRHEYPEQIAACRREIRRAEELGFCGRNARELGRSFPITVFVSPGGYICGEQSALIEAMSDHRAEPRNIPPKLETNGLHDFPTLVSNVETFAWTPFILLKGGQTYADEGVNTWKGRRFFSVCGDVQRPGVYEVPMGMTLRELLEGADYCQGMAEGRKLKALAPSGPSGGFLPARLRAPGGLPRDLSKNKAWLALAARRGFDPTLGELDILDLELELDLFRALSPTAALGAGLAVYAEGRDMVSEAVNSLEFFRNESCGKCVPCRLGSQKLASLGAHLLQGQITRARWETELVPLIRELNTTIGLTSICGLGRSIPMPLTTVLAFFPEDVAGHLAAAPAETVPATETAAA